MLQPLWGDQQQSISDLQEHVQVVNPSFVSRECGKSCLSVVVYHTCNALRMIDPLAGALSSKAS